MDQIRRALGEDKISYLGYSYGTFLGAEYADLFPSRVRAFILDGAVDPMLTWDDRLAGRAIAAESALKAFISDCASRPDCPFFRQDDPMAAFRKLRQDLDHAPVFTADASGKSILMDGDELVDAVAEGLLAGNWSRLTDALAALANHDDASALASLAEIGADAIDGGAGIAIDCLDLPLPGPARLQKSAAAIHDAAPDFLPLDASGSLTAECDGWPVAATGHPHEIHADGSGPILVIGSVGDPVTPYSWAQSLARQLTSGHLLTWQGHRHTVTFYNPSRSPCIDAAVTSFVVGLTIPADGTTCP
jgi:pimeloyl-ACP methyl ester carboxylesterase